MNLKELTDDELLKLKNEYENKVVQYYGLQMALKILMNSGYGALGCQYYNYFDIRIAEAVTKGGRLAIRWIMNKLNDYFNKKMGTENFDYCIYSDTDSVDIVCDKIINRFCKDKTTEEKIDFLDQLFAKPVQKIMNNSYQELADYLHNEENRMFMDREIIAENAIWAGKKRYIMSVWDKEGVRYSSPKYKIMGLDSVRSTVPDNCRNALEEAYKICLHKTNDDLFEFIEKFKQEYMSWDIEEISNSSTFSDVNKYSHPEKIFIKGTPYHIKGALIYNNMIKEAGLEDKYELFNDGDTGKIAKLKKKNPTPDKTFCYTTFFPRELGLEKYIDKEEMFRKSFIEPLHNLIDIIGWTEKKVNKLDRFFE